jgi:hypothetical protein
MWLCASICMYKSTICWGVCSVVKRWSSFNLLKNVCCLFLYPVEVLMENCSEMWLVTYFSSSGRYQLHPNGKWRLENEIKHIRHFNCNTVKDRNKLIGEGSHFHMKVYVLESSKGKPCCFGKHKFQEKFNSNVKYGKSDHSNHYFRKMSTRQFLICAVVYSSTLLYPITLMPS